MNVKLLILVLSLFPLSLATQCSQLSSNRNAVEVKSYDCVYLLVNANPSHYKNPFDFDEVLVQASFSSNSINDVVDGFYFQDYERSLVGGKEHLEKAGDPQWKVMYTPKQVGKYTFNVTLTDVNGTQIWDSGSFQVSDNAGGDYGFVEIDEKSLHFKHGGSQTPYFAIGENVCWSDSNGTYDYDLWFEHLSLSGGNYARLWVGGYIGFNLENELGKYNLPSSWRLDYVLSLATKLNMKLMFTMDSFNSLRKDTPYPDWDKFPYNKANGGMLTEPREFFLSSEAFKIYSKRWRYIIARYGWSTNMLSMEFFNEVDLTDGFVDDIVAKWHSNGSKYIRSHDIYNHLLTTSSFRSSGTVELDTLPGIDYAQTHTYDADDLARDVSQWNTLKTVLYKKPHLCGESGLSQDTSIKHDKNGIALHNSLWGSVSMLGAGTAMNWWWDMYIEVYDLYHHFKPVSEIANKVDWLSGKWEPVSIISMNSSSSSSNGYRVLGSSSQSSVIFWAQDTNNTWEKHNPTGYGPTTISISCGLTDGSYTIDCYSTYESSVKKSTQIVKCSSGIIDDIKVPALTVKEPDLVCIN